MLNLHQIVNLPVSFQPLEIKVERLHPFHNNEPLIVCLPNTARLLHNNQENKYYRIVNTFAN